MLAVVSSLVGTVFAAAWIYAVMVVGGRNDFSHAQVTGACINVLGVTVALTWWGYRQGINAKSVIHIVTISLSFAFGMAFALISAPTDSTGLWGVGFLIIMVCSLLGVGVVTTVVVAMLRWVTPQKKQ